VQSDITTPTYSMYREFMVEMWHVLRKHRLLPWNAKTKGLYKNASYLTRLTFMKGLLNFNSLWKQILTFKRTLFDRVLHLDHHCCFMALPPRTCPKTTELKRHHIQRYLETPYTFASFYPVIRPERLFMPTFSLSVTFMRFSIVMRDGRSSLPDIFRKAA
jgi:hypothetical protein